MSANYPGIIPTPHAPIGERKQGGKMNSLSSRKQSKDAQEAR